MGLKYPLPPQEEVIAELAGLLAELVLAPGARARIAAECGLNKMRVSQLLHWKPTDPRFGYTTLQRLQEAIVNEKGRQDADRARAQAS